MEKWQAIDLIEEELRTATHLFGKMYDAHQGLCIIQEEFEELKAEVFNNNRTRDELTKEAVQLGAMALRFLVDIC